MTERVYNLCITDYHPPPIHGVGILITATLLLGLFTPVYAAPTIGIQDNSPVDIVLTGGDTDFDYDGFADKLKAELIAAGVSEPRINIKASEEKAFTSSGSGLQQMLAEFEKFPSTAQNPYITQYGDLFGPIVAGGQPVPFHGLFRREQSSGSAEVSIMTRLFCPAHSIVISPRLRDNSDGTVSGYLCIIRGDGYGGATLTPGNFNGSDTAPVRVDLIKVANQRLSDMVFFLNGVQGFDYTKLATSSPIQFSFSGGHSYGPGIYWGTPVYLDVEVSGTTITMYNLGKKVLEYTDTQDVITGGGVLYGMAMASHGGISEISFKLGAITPLVDAVRSSDWKMNSSRFIVDVCDIQREDFMTPEKLTELAQRMRANDAYYIGWGRTTVSSGEIPSKNSMEQFIKLNGRLGTFMDNSIGQSIYRKTALYIEPIVNKRADLSGRVYLFKDKEYLYKEE